MRKIYIVTARYPSKDNLYSHMFLHPRMKGYINRGIEAEVLIPSKVEYTREYDGVVVRFLSNLKIYKLSLEEEAIFYIHLLGYKIDPRTNAAVLYYLLRNSENIFFYGHGAEFQDYKSRYFERDEVSLIKVVLKDNLTIPIVGFLFRKYFRSSRFIFPSFWMRDDFSRCLNFQNFPFSIVPNPVDYSVFNIKTSFGNRIKDEFVLVRSLNSRKYAVDIAIELVSLIPEMSLRIVGDGKYFEDYKRLAEKLNLEKRVHFDRKFLTHSELSDLYNSYQFALFPTMMDAQGVSMCEAALCGCHIITSRNSAVTEYFKHGEGSFLINNDTLGENIDALREYLVNQDDVAMCHFNLRSELLISKEIDLFGS